MASDPWMVVCAELARTLAPNLAAMLLGSRLELAARENGEGKALYRVLIAPDRAAAGLDHFRKQATNTISRSLSSLLQIGVEVEIVAQGQS
jgi:hypothetical protein